MADEDAVRRTIERSQYSVARLHLEALMVDRFTPVSGDTLALIRAGRIVPFRRRK